MKQTGFTDLEYSARKKKTRRERFLEEMDQIIPWRELLQVIKRHYPKGRGGRPTKEMETMLRIYFLQQWYALSDPAMEESLYDIQSMRRFAGVDMDAIPDESTILRFRHLLERHNLAEQLFRKTEQYLSDRDLILSQGTIVDATFVSAPSSTRNQERKRDPEMRSGKKGNQWHFGMKVHVGTDTRGRAHSVAVTDASVHDSRMMDDLLHGEEEVIYADKAYADQDKQAAMESSGVRWRVNRKGTRSRKLNCADRAFNRKSNRTRARVEHLFGVIKHLWRYRKVRYKGIAKNAGQVFTLVALANLYLARRELLST